MTAVMRFADASFAAWIMKTSSMMLRSTGSQPVCTTKMSAPRMDSSYRTYVSPFGNVLTSTSPSSTPSCWAIRIARSVCERPENTISRFCGPRSIQWPGDDCVTTVGSRPGRTSSGLALARCISLLVLLPRPGHCEGIGGDVLRYDRTCGDPSPVPDLERCDEAIVDAGPDVAA